MSGDQENIREYRYGTPCSGCGRKIQTRAASGSRWPGAFVRCYQCKWVNWATKPVESKTSYAGGTA